jgi:hypothetical protein
MGFQAGFSVKSTAGYEEVSLICRFLLPQLQATFPLNPSLLDVVGIGEIISDIMENQTPA